MPLFGSSLPPQRSFTIHLSIRHSHFGSQAQTIQFFGNFRSQTHNCLTLIGKNLKFLYIDCVSKFNNFSFALRSFVNCLPKGDFMVLCLYFFDLKWRSVITLI